MKLDIRRAGVMAAAITAAVGIAAFGILSFNGHRPVGAASPPIWRDSAGVVHFVNPSAEQEFRDKILARAKPQTAWPTGILESGQAPFPSMQYSIRNQWQGEVGGQHVQVYAGFLTSDTTQGLVLVRTLSADLSQASVKRHLTTLKLGGLRIISANGTSLVLRSDTGAVVTFDAQLDQLGGG